MALDKNKVYTATIIISSVGDEDMFDFTVSFNPPLTAIDYKEGDTSPASWQLAGEMVKFLAQVGDFDSAEVNVDLDEPELQGELFPVDNVVPFAGKPTS